ncbi:MAG: TIM barrel protein [Candidatus Diapherotrites archaeon]|uniref:TIM barrel protein n=1 Tax=Candidatus Iainarchaeum sp. TaxID=3101447 RepID=A0A8T5GFM4_9ARCH|nr:TIM barrel protein [Candidatus Diapherotrites archaeon]MBT7241211.1 TIM barrel protein [Candidatus Diapherotrites archaeon]
MDLGLKTYPIDLEKTKEVVDLFDFVELLIPPNYNPKELLNYNFSFNIHVAHEKFGYNPADIKQRELSKSLIQKALEAADLIKADYIVVHPGYSKDEKDELNVLDFFDDCFDKRMLIENCPIGAWQSNFFFSTPKKIAEFISRYKSSFLFDVGHAILSANTLNENIFDFISRFEKLNSKVHHVYGTEINSTLTEHHKHFHQVESDYSYLSMLNPESTFVFETDLVSRSERSDYEKNIAFLNSFLCEKETIKE